jgi:hypothetical protein
MKRMRFLALSLIRLLAIATTALAQDVKTDYGHHANFPNTTPIIGRRSRRRIRYGRIVFRMRSIMSCRQKDGSARTMAAMSPWLPWAALATSRHTGPSTMAWEAGAGAVLAKPRPKLKTTVLAR